MTVICGSLEAFVIGARILTGQENPVYFMDLLPSTSGLIQIYSDLPEDTPFAQQLIALGFIWDADYIHAWVWDTTNHYGETYD